MSNDCNRAVAQYDLNYMVIGIHLNKIQDYVHLNKKCRPNLYKEDLTLQKHRRWKCAGIIAVHYSTGTLCQAMSIGAS